MKNRQFDTEKLAASIKVLVKAAGLRNSEVCKDVRMSPLGTTGLLKVN